MISLVIFSQGACQLPGYTKFWLITRALLSVHAMQGKLIMQSGYSQRYIHNGKWPSRTVMATLSMDEIWHEQNALFWINELSIKSYEMDEETTNYIFCHYIFIQSIYLLHHMRSFFWLKRDYTRGGHSASE